MATKKTAPKSRTKTKAASAETAPVLHQQLGAGSHETQRYGDVIRMPHGLPENVAQGELPDGTRQVSLRSNAYMGPGAPPGPYHHYTFELYALDTKLEVPQGTPQEAAATRTAVVNAMDGHVLGKAVLVARFHRQPQ